MNALRQPKAPDMILYGLPTCSECNRARKELADAGYDVAFRDIRMEPLSEEEWAVLLAEFGDTLVDRKSQAFRNLNAWMRESEAETQLTGNPAIMARPVITDGTNWSIGRNDVYKTTWLG